MRFALHTDIHHALFGRAEPPHCHEVRFGQVTPDRRQVARLLGVQDDRPAHRRWLRLIDELIEELAPLAEPRGLYRIDRLQRLDRRELLTESGARFRGAVAGFLAGAHRVAAFVVTIGPQLENLARRWLKSGDVMRGTIADAIASEAVESAAGQLQQIVARQVADDDASVTPRYSPGYCGMNVDQQQPLFAWLPAERIGVRLSESCLMTPIKSISGLIGIGPRAVIGPQKYPCTRCAKSDCMMRRAPAAVGAAGRLDELVGAPRPSGHVHRPGAGK